MRLLSNKTKHFSSYALLSLIASFLYGCGGTSTSGGYGYGDGPPPTDIDVSALPDAVPKVEPIRKAGNKSPYTVFG